MTNELSVEDAIEVFKFMKREVLEDSKEDKVLDMAIQALEQEPILDKIITEIQKLRGCSCSCSDGIIDDVEDIIDKYKAEREDKE